MKKILMIALLLSVTEITLAQVIVKGYHYHPTGDFGFVFKPTFSAELGVMGSFIEGRKLRGVVTGTYVKLKPRLNEIPITGVRSDGTGDHILPGTQSFKKYNIAQLLLGFDYAFIRKEKFFVYGGFDLTVGRANVVYTEYVQTYMESSYDGGGVLGGCRFRLGAEYLLNPYFSLLINAQRGGWLLTDPAAINFANDYGLGVKYNLNL
ncbi:MAG TPA: hypothetical protein VFF27_09550 [Bacteroidia bacterium]|jgi:hypothetical protein|nr:hypothetical protein [Bacteroidia bacterium]